MEIIFYLWEADRTFQWGNNHGVVITFPLKASVCSSVKWDPGPNNCEEEMRSTLYGDALGAYVFWSLLKSELVPLQEPCTPSPDRPPTQGSNCMVGRGSGSFDLTVQKPQWHLWRAGQGGGQRALASGSAWLIPSSPGLRGELQRQGCVSVASFVPAPGRKTSQGPLLLWGGSSDPSRYSLLPFMP